MFRKAVFSSTVLLVFSVGPASALLYLVYHFRVEEDSTAVYSSISLGILLFLGAFTSTVITMLQGMRVLLFSLLMFF
jgi:hypothetical protein